MHYLLTGATSGIGRAFLDLQLTQASNASASAPIFTVIARNAAKFSELATYCQPNSCQVINLDLAHPELIAPTVTEALKDLPPVDRLVYCAGITRIEAVTKLTYPKNLEMMSICYFSLVELIRVLVALKPESHLLKVAVVSAMAATTGAAYTVSYSAAKKALETLVRFGAQELLTQNVFINALAPAYVDTPMLKFNRMIDRNFAQNVTQVQPLGLISPQTAAQELAELLESTSCTGTIRYLNGGMRY